jgi:hypothetical protein
MIRKLLLPINERLQQTTNPTEKQFLPTLPTSRQAFARVVIAVNIEQKETHLFVFVQRKALQNRVSTLR